MFCKKCGKPMADNAKFCGSCGAAVVQETPAQPVNNPIPTPAVPNEQKISEVIPEIPTIATTTQVANKKPGVNPVIIALGAVVAVLIAVIVFLVAGRGGEAVSSKGMELNVDQTSSETESVSYVISGSASSYDEDAVLTVDGYEVVYLQAGDNDVLWSKEVWLSEGENFFEVELVSENGDRQQQTVEIEYAPSLLYPEGTVLIKSDPAGIFVRPTPAITKEYILYLPYYDFETQLVCQGEEYRDGEGFIWCKVKIPGGQTGWVRSDIIKRY